VKNAILKFAANNFVIRTNNPNRIGQVYFERDRQRAVFQYWIKMILSGVTTSVGAKSNKKQIKKYMKNLNQKKLPPIDENLVI
jgi:deoxyhypusine synthase